MKPAPCPTLQKLLELDASERMLGPYRLTDQLGHGGFAPVWLAREVHDGREFRTVAIKLFCVEEDAGGARGYTRAAREHILDEARALCQVEHPNIVRFYNFQTDPSGAVLGLVMEYARGVSVDKRLNEQGKLALADALALGVAVASALAAVHASGIVHRDVKPANVVLDAAGVYKLIDFGIAAGGEPRSRRAREIEAEQAPASSTRVVLDDLPLDVKGTKLVAFASSMIDKRDATFAGMAAGDMPSGTLGYLDPDCIAHLSRATPASDLYSLAAMLYECLTGLVPAAAANAVAGRGGLKPEVVDGREAPPPIGEVAPETPPPLAALLDSMLAVEPSARPPTAADVRARLEAIRDTKPKALSIAPAAAKAKTSPSARVAPILAGAAVIAVFVGAWQLMKTPAPVVPAVIAAGAASFERAAGSAAAPSAPAPVPSAPTEEITEPPWGLVIADGQAALARGDATGALEKFSQAAERGGGATARAFVENVSAATAVTQTCALVAFSHPRLLPFARASRPSIAPAGDGSVVVWTDDHETAGHEHAYSVRLDATGHPRSTLHDLTPEGDRVFRPTLEPAADKLALVYWDASGQYPGVRARWVSADGRLAGPSILIDPGKPGNLWPTLGALADGFVVAWQDDRATGNDEVYLRRLDKGLRPVGDEAQATSVGVQDASAITPSVARFGDALIVAYVLEHGDKNRVIKLRKFALGGEGSPLKSWGNEQIAALGDERAAPEGPQVACGSDGCFVAWHAAAGAASIALVDPGKKRVRWTKRLSARGAHPAIAIAPDGRAAVAFFDGALVRIARVDERGLAASSVIGKTGGDPPRPSIIAGAGGDWHVAWLGMEDGHPEPYAARATCKD